MRPPLAARAQTVLASTAPAAAATWQSLRGQLSGSLVLPGDSGYPTAREVGNARYNVIQPRGIAYCASATDVQRCIAFARAHGLPLALRSGGHSYAGYSTSTGLIADVSTMNQIAADPAAGTATVGAGAQQIDIYAGLAQAGVLVPGASCPTVGIAGLALGGGIGVLDRKFGLTLDNVLSLQIVTADGMLRTCDAAHDPDLFWACRGGGGGNFGAVISFTFRTHAIGDLALFHMDWPWAAAAQALPAWLSWAPHAPDELWSNCTLSGGGRRSSPALSTSGVYFGGQQALSALLDDLVRIAGAQPSSRSVWQSGFVDAMLGEAGCAGETVGQCHRGPLASMAGGAFAARSDFIAAQPDDRGVAAMLSTVDLRDLDVGGGALIVDACGGAVNRVPADATAFVHRGDLCSVQYFTSWSGDAAGQANRAWLDAAYAAMRPVASGYAYQNYIDPDLQDWQHAYYGSNFDRLVGVKKAYDPDDFFHFAQSIPVRV